MCQTLSFQKPWGSIEAQQSTAAKWIEISMPVNCPFPPKEALLYLLYETELIVGVGGSFNNISVC